MVFFAVHRVLLVGLLEERIAHFHCGDALWRMRLVVSHIEMTMLSSRSQTQMPWVVPAREQIVDERNVYGIGPRIERGIRALPWRGPVVPELSDDDGLWKGEVCTLSVGANSFVLARWMGYRLGGASLSRQNGVRCEHVDSDGQKLFIRAAVLTRPTQILWLR